MNVPVQPEDPIQPPALNRPAIPHGVPIRVVGDVHGDAKAFAYAVATDRFVVQLGDLVDYGPDSATVLELMFRLIDEGRGLFLIGNHDFKLARALAGQHVLRRLPGSLCVSRPIEPWPCRGCACTPKAAAAARPTTASC